MADVSEVGTGRDARLQCIQFVALYRRALDQLVDSQRLAETPLLRRAAQLLVRQWVRAGEWARETSAVSAKKLEARGQQRLVRLARNFARNLREEMKKIDRSGRG